MDPQYVVQNQSFQKETQVWISEKIFVKTTAEIVSANGEMLLLQLL
jgi:hypothetical protein